MEQPKFFTVTNQEALNKARAMFRTPELNQLLGLVVPQKDFTPRKAI